MDIDQLLKENAFLLDAETFFIFDGIGDSTQQVGIGDNTSQSLG
jgi:hypothetical protein